MVSTEGREKGERKSSQYKLINKEGNQIYSLFKTNFVIILIRLFLVNRLCAEVFSVI